MLNLTTPKRFVLIALVFFAWAPAAHAWSWPVQGPVLQPFSYDEAHPYAAGQHRGVDIGADAAGEKVVAPAAGTVAFAGSVPSSGESVTIETSDGYSVTLTHLGSIVVSKGASIAEGEPIGAIGPSGTPEVDGPYVHLGIRVTADPNGYLDPLRFLPPPSASDPVQSDPPASQPSAGGGAVTTPASQPAPTSTSSEPAASTSTPSATARGANVRTTRSSARSSRARGQASRSHSSVTATHEVRWPRSSERPVPQPAPAPRLSTPNRRVDAPTSSSRRPVVEVAVPAARLRLDAGHELMRGRPDRLRRHPQAEQPSLPLALACNGAAALVALGAAFAAGLGARRRRAGGGPRAQVLHLQSPTPGALPVRRAA